MKLIFALGNHGTPYHLTRHNFGTLALDFYAKTHHLTFVESKKFTAQIAKTNAGNTLLIKPTSFYNEIGKPIADIIHFYKTPLSDVLIICDDFSLPFGTLRLRNSGSSAGNNGLKSIIEHLGTDTFPRLRLGTDSPARKQLGDIDFVLSRFTPAEQAQLASILTQASTYFPKATE